MTRQELTYKTSTISYLCFGRGPKTVFCFHGYAEESGYFGFLDNHLANTHRFVAIDLPYHGQTVWNEDIFTAGDLVAVIRIIAANLEATDDDKIVMAGFSLGGRMALAAFEHMPETIERVVLLAPDGLKLNFWYWLSTQTWIGNRLFVYTMKHPGWFFVLLKLFRKLRLVNASILKFVAFYIDDPQAREILYRRWTVLRRIKPRLSYIRKLALQTSAKFRLVYGKHDRIILPVRGQKFIRGIESQSRLEIIDSGHQVLHARHADAFIRALMQ